MGQVYDIGLSSKSNIKLILSYIQILRSVSIQILFMKNHRNNGMYTCTLKVTSQFKTASILQFSFIYMYLSSQRRQLNRTESTLNSYVEKHCTSYQTSKKYMFPQLKTHSICQYDIRIHLFLFCCYIFYLVHVVSGWFWCSADASNYLYAFTIAVFTCIIYFPDLSDNLLI